MTEQLTASIVRILDVGGAIAGAGFLVSEEHVLTCAHVVARALGLPDDTLKAPQVGVGLDFPLVAPEHVLTAHVILWQPESDVAGLELDGDPPAGARAVCLVTADDLWGHPFRAFGFPAGHDDGVWASGLGLGLITEIDRDEALASFYSLRLTVLIVLGVTILLSAGALIGYMYAKKFPYFEGVEYPDQGSSVEVYTANGLPYLEVEVLSPLVDLAPGASYTFTEDWYAAKVHGPTLVVNEAGAIRDRLCAEEDGGTTRLTGTYGVFHVGAVEIVFQDPSGHITGSGGMLPVSPAETFVLDRTATLPSGTGKVVLELTNKDGELMGILDVLTLAVKTGIHLWESDSPPAKFGLRPNLPNPFNPSTTIIFDIPENRGGADVRLVVYDSLGQSIRTLVDGRVRSGTSSVVWDGKDAVSSEVSSGVYLCQLRMRELVDTKKMVLVR